MVLTCLFHYLPPTFTCCMSSRVRLLIVPLTLLQVSMNLTLPFSFLLMPFSTFSCRKLLCSHLENFHCRLLCKVSFDILPCHTHSVELMFPFYILLLSLYVLYRIVITVSHLKARTMSYSSSHFQCLAHRCFI